MSCITRIINAAPALRIIGLDDNGGGNTVVPERAIPQHVPLWIFQGRKGPVGWRLTDPAEMSAIYGHDALNLTNPFANHQTVGMARSMQEGNIAVTYRVSAGVKANFSLGIDIMPELIDNYERMADGRIKYDSAGAPVIDAQNPKVQGYSAKIIQRSRVMNNDDDFGNLTIQNGSQTDSNGDPSQYYPLVELMEETPGEHGNNSGILWYSPEASLIDGAEVLQQRSYPYMFSIIQRDNEYDTGGIYQTRLEESAIEVHLNPQVKNPYDGDSMYMEDLIKDRYTQDSVPGLPLKIGPYSSNVKLYEDNIKTVLQMLYNAERDYILANPNAISSHPTDPITANGGEEYVFNLLSGKDYDGVPYYSFTFDVQGAIADGILPTKNTRIWAGSGEDRIMNTTEYEREVRKIIAMYGDCSNEVQDLATHPENWFYDTGFSWITKKSLKEFISQRPDTQVAWGTASDTLDVAGYVKRPDPNPLPPDWVVPEISNLTRAEELQIGGILEAEALSKPESTFYGTPAIRGWILSNSGESAMAGWNREVNYTHYLIPRNSNRYGQADGKWKRGAGFSSYPNNIINEIKSKGKRWMDYETEVLFWQRSINFPYSFDYDRDFMPALQSVYPDDTSTLNAGPNVQMVTNLWTIAYKAWRRFSSTDDKSPSELASAVKRYVLSEVDGSYDELYNIAVLVYFTKDDEERGYSWTLKFMVEQPMSYTVQNVIIETYRFGQILNQDLIRA